MSDVTRKEFEALEARLAQISSNFSGMLSPSWQQIFADCAALQKRLDAAETPKTATPKAKTATAADLQGLMEQSNAALQNAKSRAAVFERALAVHPNALTGKHYTKSEAYDLLIRAVMTTTDADLKEFADALLCMIVPNHPAPAAETPKAETHKPIEWEYHPRACADSVPTRIEKERSDLPCVERKLEALGIDGKWRPVGQYTECCRACHAPNDNHCAGCPRGAAETPEPIEPVLSGESWTKTTGKSIVPVDGEYYWLHNTKTQKHEPACFCNGKWFVAGLEVELIPSAWRVLSRIPRPASGGKAA